MPKVLQPIQRITNGDMSQNSLTSEIVDGRYLCNVTWQIAYSGSPQGTFSLQESLDYNPQIAGSGTWIDNGAGINPAVPGTGYYLINLSNRAPRFYRLVYTMSSGTGVLNVWASGSGPA